MAVGVHSLILYGIWLSVAPPTGDEQPSMTDPKQTGVTDAERQPALEVAGGDRLDPSRDPGAGDLRGHTARGTLVNSSFQIGISALNVIQRLVVAAFLTRAEFGLWGVLTAILVNLGWLKNLGISDKYIQQAESDQEEAFQKAFTLELVTSVGFFLLIVLVLPLWAMAYGHLEIILPGILVALAVPISAFETPSWIPYRRMQYARQRYLTAIDPVVGFAVTVALAVAGMGYWCFVAGFVAGSLAGAIVCTATSPYRLRLRFERSTLREYVSFSWPLVGSALSRLLVVQGSLLVANHTVGLAGIGVIALATSIAVFADRVDGIVSQTIYPAVCAVVHRRELLAEIFAKSNRVALMWAMPFGVALALFAGDLVTFVLGEKWQSAVGLLAVFGVTCAFGQVAFNWRVFLRAVNDTRPIFIGSVLDVIAFLGVGVPAMFAFGLPGYAAGFAAAIFVQILVRGYYMRRLFRFNIGMQLVRAVAPTVPGLGLVLLARALVDGQRTLPLAVGELALYSVAVIAFTLMLERRLVVEIVGYVRSRGVRARSAVREAPA
jgi:O-antigen/teichoic acid export membrane protein